MQGPAGNLDLWTVYMATGTARTDGLVRKRSKLKHDASTKDQRKERREALAAHMMEVGKALSTVAGDLNTVTSQVDRWGGDQALRQGKRDRQEENHWREKVAIPLHLHEFWQEEPTFEHNGGKSRIDRVYSNMPVADQLDKHGVAALEWTPITSNHRAVAFARTTTTDEADELLAFPDWVFKTSEWKRNAVRAF